jgi:hypothetical protein
MSHPHTQPPLEDEPTPNAQPPARRRTLRGVAVALTFAALVATGGSAAAERLTPVLVCSSGPSGQHFNVGVSIPGKVEVGSTYTVRIDGVSSGKISHVGLNYLHDMTVEYALPAGATYVEGSAAFVPGTGTANVSAHARLTHSGGVLTMLLPDKVAEGSSYTPPSITVQLKATEAPGTRAVVGFRRFSMKANAVVVGDVSVSCDPQVKPYPIGSTLVTPAL